MTKKQATCQFSEYAHLSWALKLKVPVYKVSVRALQSLFVVGTEYRARAALETKESNWPKSYMQNMMSLCKTDVSSNLVIIAYLAVFF